MKSEWEKIEKEFNSVTFEEYDADDHSDTHKNYGIKDVPTVIVLDDSGDEIIRLEGAKEKEEILKIIKEAINKL